MGKIISVISLCLIVLLVGFFPVNVQAADHLAASCSSHDLAPPMGGAGITNYQRFTPGYDRISRYGFYFEGSGGITLGIRQVGGAVLTSNSVTIDGARVYLITIDTPITVVAGNQYEIWATSGDIGNAMGVNSNAGCYGSTNANINGFDSIVDLQFAVYGYNQSELNPTPVPAPVSSTAVSGDSSNNQTGSSSSQTDSSTSSSTESPSNSPVSSIEKVSNIKGEYIAQSNSNKITWTKSATEDIDGYRIYRSEDKTRGFKSVGKSDNKTYEYLDKSITAGKTYYYFVRAYKGKEESFSSQTVSVAVPAAGVSPTVSKTALSTAPLTSQKSRSGFNWPLITGGIVVVLAGLAVLYWKVIIPRYPNLNLFKKKTIM